MIYAPIGPAINYDQARTPSVPLHDRNWALHRRVLLLQACSRFNGHDTLRTLLALSPEAVRLCTGSGIEMPIARLGEGLIVKRMPGTGDQHAPAGPSYEPPADLSDLGQVLGSAITEDPATGETALKLGFSVSRFLNDEDWRPLRHVTEPGATCPSWLSMQPLSKRLRQDLTSKCWITGEGQLRGSAASV